MRLNRLFPIQLGIIAAFLLIPLWYRLPTVPPLLPPLYVSRFLILLPMLWTVGWWLGLGLPGFHTLRQDPARRLWALALLLLVLWAFLSQTWAFRRVENPEVGASAALQFGCVALFALVVACTAPSRRWLTGALVVGLVGSSIVAILQVTQQSSIGLQALGEFRLDASRPGVSVVQAGAVRWLRPYGLLPHPNILAGFLMIALLSAGAWIVAGRRWWWAVGAVVAAFGFWALLLTFSRAAWGGLVIGGLVALWRVRPWSRRLWLSAALLIVVALAFLQAYRPFLLARAGVSTESIELRSISDRAVFNGFALRAVREFPIGGVGMGNFPWRSSYYLVFTNFDLRGDNVHNIYLSAWAELGTVGLVLLLAALGSGVWAALRRPPDPHAAFLFAGFIALSAIGLLDHYPWTLIQFQAAWWGLLAASAAR